MPDAGLFPGSGWREAAPENNWQAENFQSKGGLDEDCVAAYVGGWHAARSRSPPPLRGVAVACGVDCPCGRLGLARRLVRQVRAQQQRLEGVLQRRRCPALHHDAHVRALVRYCGQSVPSCRVSVAPSRRCLSVWSPPLVNSTNGQSAHKHTRTHAAPLVLERPTTCKHRSLTRVRFVLNSRYNWCPAFFTRAVFKRNLSLLAGMLASSVAAPLAAEETSLCTGQRGRREGRQPLRTLLSPWRRVTGAGTAPWSRTPWRRHGTRPHRTACLPTPATSTSSRACRGRTSSSTAP